MNAYIELDALWKVLVASLLAGAGLAAVFSLSLVGLSSGRTAGPGGSRALPPGRGRGHRPRSLRHARQSAAEPAPTPHRTAEGEGSFRWTISGRGLGQSRPGFA